MKTVTALAILSLLVMGFATLIIGGFASSSRLLGGNELYGFLIALFVVGAMCLWSFLLWIAVACKILLWLDREEAEEDEYEDGKTTGFYR